MDGGAWWATAQGSQRFGHDLSGFTTALQRFPRLPCSSVSKESACNAGDLGLIPGLGRYPGEGNANPLQYSCLENPTDRGAWWATVQGVARGRHNLGTKPPPQRFPRVIDYYLVS